MKRKPDIIEAIKNPKLFSSLPRFRKLDTWASWLVALKAIFGLPMSSDDLVVFHRHTGRNIFDRYNIISDADLHEASERQQAYLAKQKQEPTTVTSMTAGN